MPTTTPHLLPYPAGTDNVDIPGDMQALAEAVDDKITESQDLAIVMAIALS